MKRDNKTYVTEQKTAQNAKSAEICTPLCVFGILDTEKGREMRKTHREITRRERSVPMYYKQ